MKTTIWSCHLYYVQYFDFEYIKDKWADHRLWNVLSWFLNKVQSWRLHRLWWKLGLIRPKKLTIGIRNWLCSTCLLWVVCFDTLWVWNVSDSYFRFVLKDASIVGRSMVFRSERLSLLCITWPFVWCFVKNRAWKFKYEAGWLLFTGKWKSINFVTLSQIQFLLCQGAKMTKIKIWTKNTIMLTRLHDGYSLNLSYNKSSCMIYCCSNHRCRGPSATTGR